MPQALSETLVWVAALSPYKVALVTFLVIFSLRMVAWYLQTKLTETANELSSLPAYHQHLQGAVRQFMQEYIGDDLRAHIASLRTSREQHQNDLAQLEAQMTEELRAELRNLVVEARRSGVPIQVIVTSRDEAHLLRETVGPATVHVSKRVQLKPPTVLPAPPPTNGEPVSVWDRLSAEDPEEPEEPCPTSLPEPEPPPNRRSKKRQARL